jgi:hypothetical protein
VVRKSAKLERRPDDDGTGAHAEAQRRGEEKREAGEKVTRGFAEALRSSFAPFRVPKRPKFLVFLRLPGFGRLWDIAGGDKSMEVSE